MKIFHPLLTALIVFGFVACNKNNTQDEKEPESSSNFNEGSSSELQENTEDAEKRESFSEPQDSFDEKSSPGPQGNAEDVGFANAGVSVALSEGNKFAKPSLWVESYGYNAGGCRVENHPRMIADGNGDSKADVVGFGEAGIYVSLATGVE